MADNPDDTPKFGWGPGFVRGFEVGVSRFADVLRSAMVADGFVEAWGTDAIETFISRLVVEANRVRPSR